MRNALALLLLIICGLGCKPKATMPTPLPVAELPTALEKAFRIAPAETKDMAGQVVALVRAQDYSKAHPQLLALAATPKLTPEQLDVTARGLVTLNELLQAAQAQGDTNAAQALETYRKIK